MGKLVLQLGWIPKGMSRDLGGTVEIRPTTS